MLAITVHMDELVDLQDAQGNHLGTIKVREFPNMGKRRKLVFDLDPDIKIVRRKVRERQAAHPTGGPTG